MKENPISEILRTSLENIGHMVDANKVVGEPIVLPNNSIAIPISKVICGYGVGGSEITNKNKNVKNEFSNDIFPFGGGSGGGLTITPTAFIIIQENNIKIMNVEKKNDVVYKLFDAFKDMIKK